MNLEAVEQVSGVSGQGRLNMGDLHLLPLGQLPHSTVTHESALRDFEAVEQAGCVGGLG